MNKVTAWLENGQNNVYLKNGYIETRKDEKITLRNVAIYWKLNNVHKYNYEITMVSASGARTVIQFGVGYWSFNMIMEQLAEESISLKKNKHNNTCRIHCETHSLELGNFGLLLGFEKDTVIQRGNWTDSNTVNINMGLKYITIGCSCVDSLKNFDTNGERSKTIATFPITTEQPLNEYISFYKDVNFEAPVSNGTYNLLTFDVGSNVKNEEIDLNILVECQIK